jgi:hypothetical protein
MEEKPSTATHQVFEDSASALQGGDGWVETNHALEMLPFRQTYANWLIAEQICR